MTTSASPALVWLGRPPRAEPERLAAMDRTCGQVVAVVDVDSDGVHDLHRRPDTRLLQIKLKRPE